MKKTKEKLFVVLGILFIALFCFSGKARAVEGYSVEYTDEGSNKYRLVINFDKDLDTEDVQSGWEVINSKKIRDEHVYTKSSNAQAFSVSFKMSDESVVQVKYTLPITIDINDKDEEFDSEIFSNVTSNDTSIVRIGNNGKIEPVKAGKTKITATRISSSETFEWDIEVIGSKDDTNTGDNTGADYEKNGYSVEFTDEGSDKFRLVVSFDKDVDTTDVQSKGWEIINSKKIRDAHIYTKSSKIQYASVPVKMATGTVLQVKYTLPVTIDINNKDEKFDSNIFSNVTSNDTSIVKIGSNGEIEPVKVGKTTLTATRISSSEVLVWDIEVVGTAQSVTGSGANNSGSVTEAKSGTNSVGTSSEVDNTIVPAASHPKTGESMKIIVILSGIILATIAIRRKTKKYKVIR